MQLHFLGDMEFKWCTNYAAEGADLFNVTAVLEHTGS